MLRSVNLDSDSNTLKIFKGEKASIICVTQRKSVAFIGEPGLEVGLLFKTMILLPDWKLPEGKSLFILSMDSIWNSA